MKYLNLKYFLFAFGLGLFFVYTFGDVPKIVFKYPTPDNIDETQYKDSANNCYEYVANEIKCPKDKKKINNIPIMHVSEDDVNSQHFISRIFNKFFPPTK